MEELHNSQGIVWNVERGFTSAVGQMSLRLDGVLILPNKAYKKDQKG